MGWWESRGVLSLVGIASAESHTIFCSLTLFKRIMQFNNFDPHIMPVMVAATSLSEPLKLAEVTTPLI